MSHRAKLNLKAALDVVEQHTASLPHTPLHSLSYATYTGASAVQLQPDMAFLTGLQPGKQKQEPPFCRDVPANLVSGQNQKRLPSRQVAPPRKLFCPHMPAPHPLLQDRWWPKLSLIPLLQTSLRWSGSPSTSRYIKRPKIKI